MASTSKSQPRATSLTTEERKYYSHLWSQVDTEGDGFVSGRDAVKFFGLSGVAHNRLAEIWDIADYGNKGVLGRPQFDIAVKLIAQAQVGKAPSLAVLQIDAPLPVFSTIKQPPEGDPTRTIADGWEGILTPAKKATYHTMFVNAGATQGRLSRAQAKEFLQSTRLPFSTCGRIWHIADANNTGFFDATSFNVAMFYSRLILDGFLTDVPDFVPIAVLRACSEITESDNRWSDGKNRPTNPWEQLRASAEVELRKNEELLRTNALEEHKKYEEILRASLEEERKRSEEILLLSIAEEKRNAKQQEELLRKAIEEEAIKTKALEEQFLKDLLGARSASQNEMEMYLKERENQQQIEQGFLEQYIKEQSEQAKALAEHIFKDQQAQSKAYQDQLSQLFQAASESLEPSVSNLPPWLQALHEEDIQNRKKFYVDMAKNTTEAGASDAVVNLCNSIMGLDLGTSSSTPSSQPSASPPSSTGPTVAPPGRSSNVSYQPKQYVYHGSVSPPVIPLPVVSSPTLTSNPVSTPLYSPYPPFSSATSPPPTSAPVPMYQEPEKLQGNAFQRPYQQEQYPYSHMPGQYTSIQLPGRHYPPTSYNTPLHSYKAPDPVQYQPLVPQPYYGQPYPPQQQQQQQQQRLPVVPTQVIVQAKAMYDFIGQNGGDLSFKAGDTINVIENTNGDWWYGSLGNNYGVFPSSYVQKLESDSNAQLLKVIAQVQAKWDLSSKDQGGLSFKVGDTINVVEYVNDDWWRGALRGNVGVFPTNYVQILKPPVNGIYPSVAIFPRPAASEAPLIDLGQQQNQSNTYLPSPPSKDAYIPPPPSKDAHIPPPGQRPHSQSLSSSKDAYIPKNPQQLAQHPSLQPYTAQGTMQSPQQYHIAQNQTKHAHAPQYLPSSSVPSLPPRAPQYREPILQTPHLPQRAPQYHPH